MPGSQINKPLVISRATTHQRLIAGAVLLFMSVFFIMGLLAAHGKITIWPYPCSFKQQYNLPCPACGMTTAFLAFLRGKVIDSFLIQPAGGLMCVALAICGFLSFIVFVFGVYFSFLTRLFEEIKIRDVIAAIIFIFAAGWAVTLAQAMAINR